MTKATPCPHGSKPIAIGGRVFPSIVALAKHYGEHRRTVQRAIAEDRLHSFIVGNLLRAHDYRKDAESIAEAKRIVDYLAGAKE